MVAHYVKALTTKCYVHLESRKLPRGFPFYLLNCAHFTLAIKEEIIIISR